MFLQTVGEYRELGQDNILIYPVGKKIEEAVKKLGFFPQGSYQKLALIYHHFKSMGVQELLRERYLPIDLSAVQNDEERGGVVNDYIIEPSAAQLIADLIPQVLSQKIFTAALDSNASEHAARTLAMQIATDNANELIQELTKQYNKTRQQAITNELLDIVGGSMA